jgi:thiol:disulfide interchange protein DsbC
MIVKHLVIASLAAFAAHSAIAADGPDAERAQIVRNVSPLLKDLPIEKVVPRPRGTLRNLHAPRDFYTDKAGSFVIFIGAMIDSKTQVNPTEKRVDEMINHKFSDFPLKDAIKVVWGNGSRVVVRFEDPNCGYCKKLMTEMNQLDNVTVYTFPIPILSPDSATKAKAI